MTEVMPRTAVRVSQPEISSDLAVSSSNIQGVSASLHPEYIMALACSATRNSQKVRRTHGTFSRDHSVSKSADNPKLLLKKY